MTRKDFLKGAFVFPLFNNKAISFEKHEPIIYTKEEIINSARIGVALSLSEKSRFKSY